MKNEACVDISFGSRQQSNRDILKASVAFGMEMAERQSLEDYIFDSLELFQKRNPEVTIERQRTHYLKGKPSKILLVLRGELAFSNQTKKYLRQELIYTFKYFEPVDFTIEESVRTHDGEGSQISRSELSKVVEEELVKQNQTLLETLKEAQTGEEQLKKELRSFMTSELQANQDIFMERILAAREPQASLKEIRLVIQELVHSELQERQKPFFEKVNRMLVNQVSKMDWRTPVQEVVQKELNHLHTELTKEITFIKEGQVSKDELKQTLQETVEEAIEDKVKGAVHDTLEATVQEAVQQEFSSLKEALLKEVQSQTETQNNTAEQTVSSAEMQEINQGAIKNELAELKTLIEANSETLKNESVNSDEMAVLDVVEIPETPVAADLVSLETISDAESNSSTAVEIKDKTPVETEDTKDETLIENPLVEAVEKIEQTDLLEEERHRMYDEIISENFDDLYEDQAKAESSEEAVPKVAITEFDQDEVLKERYNAVHDDFLLAEKDKNIFRKAMDMREYRSYVSNVEFCEFRWMQLLSEVEQVVDRYHLNDFTQEIENVGAFLEDIQSKVRKVSLSDSKIKVPKNLISELIAYNSLSDYLLYILEKNREESK